MIIQQESLTGLMMDFNAFLIAVGLVGGGLLGVRFAALMVKSLPPGGRSYMVIVLHAVLLVLRAALRSAPRSPVEDMAINFAQQNGTAQHQERISQLGVSSDQSPFPIQYLPMIDVDAVLSHRNVVVQAGN